MRTADDVSRMQCMPSEDSQPPAASKDFMTCRSAARMPGSGDSARAYSVVVCLRRHSHDEVLPQQPHLMPSASS